MATRRRTAISAAAFLAAYAVLSYAGLQWASKAAPVSQVWPAAGAAVAALLVGGLRLWPVVFVGSLAATALDRAPYPPLLGVLMAAGNAGGTAAAVWLLRWLRMDRCLRRPRDVLYLTLVGGIGSGVLSGLVAAVGLIVMTDMSSTAVAVAFGRWALGDLLGVVVVAPTLLTWARPEPLSRQPSWWATLGLLTAATAALGWAAYVAPDHPVGIYPVHLAPVLILTAFLLDARATTTVTLLASSLALIGGLTSTEPRPAVEWLGDEQFATLMSFTLALVAVMLESLRRARTALEDQRRYRETVANEERLRMSQEVGRVGSWDWDVRSGRALCTPTLLEIFAWPSSKAEVTLDEWADRIHPDDRARAVREWRACMETGEACAGDYRIVTPAGEVRHIEGRAQVVGWEQGRPARLIGVVQDVTERRAADERQRLLMREVDHRAKNALAVVQAVVRLTKAESQEAFAEAVEGRIQAIARAHNLLAASRWTGASLCKLVEEEAEAYQGRLESGERRIRMEGPDLLLEPDAAQPLALVLHELVTNAAKHGALSVPGGTVAIRWTVDARADRLRMSWCEAGGPQVPERRGRGFGSTLISASVERQLDGTFSQSWRPEGLVVELDIPLSRSTRAPRAQPAEAGARGETSLLLLVEDEALIGLDLKERLEAMGWRVVGPVGDVDEALKTAEELRPSAAVLDVNLGGESSAPVARKLVEMGVPFAFATGYSDYAAGAGEFDVPVLIKPATTEELAQLLVALGVSPRGAKSAGGG